MSLVTTTCPTCGVIDVPIAQVVLRVRDRAEGGTCVVRCPDCGGHVATQADLSMTVLLITAGVEVSYWPVGAGERDAGEFGPITHDDLIQFAAVLADDSRLATSLVSF